MVRIQVLWEDPFTSFRQKKGYFPSKLFLLNLFSSVCVNVGTMLLWESLGFLSSFIGGKSCDISSLYLLSNLYSKSFLKDGRQKQGEHSF